MKFLSHAYALMIHGFRTSLVWSIISVVISALQHAVVSVDRLELVHLLLSYFSGPGYHRALSSSSNRVNIALLLQFL